MHLQLLSLQRGDDGICQISMNPVLHSFSGPLSANHSYNTSMNVRASSSTTWGPTLVCPIPGIRTSTLFRDASLTVQSDHRTV